MTLGTWHSHIWHLISDTVSHLYDMFTHTHYRGDVWVGKCSWMWFSAHLHDTLYMISSYIISSYTWHVVYDTLFDSGNLSGYGSPYHSMFRSAALHLVSHTLYLTSSHSHIIRATFESGNLLGVWVSIPLYVSLGCNVDRPKTRQPWYHRSRR